LRRGTLLCGAALLLLASARSSLAQVGFLAFGDSITLGVGDDPARTEKGYPPRLRALLVNSGLQATVQNAGWGGETTGEGLTRIDGVLAALPTSTEAILLMEGTNDLSQGIGFETTMFDLRQMALKAEAKGLAVVHATCIPRWPAAWVDYNNVTNLRLAENIRDLAGTRSRDLADPYEVFSNLPNLFSTYYAPLDPDPVGHPNAAGYDQLAQTFFNVLRDLDRVAPVPGITNPLHGAEGVSASSQIAVDVWDFGAGIDLAATRLVVNGVETNVVPTGTTRHAQLTYQPPQPLAGLVRVGLRSRDLAAPTPNATDKEVARFLVAGTTVLAGDIDRDGRVDGRDLVHLARRFGAHLGETRYLAAADLNADGTIEGGDLAVLASNFGRSTF
jgi:lysophospholipase L1-like esterase